MTVELRVLPDLNHGSFRAEVFVSQNLRNELDDAKFVLVSTRENTNNIEVPASIFYDENLPVGTMAVSKTIANSLGLTDNKQFHVLLCTPLKNVSIARRIGIRSTVHYQRHASMSAYLTLKTIRDISYNSLMHQVFNGSSRFFVTDWLTVFVSCYDEPSVHDENVNIWVVDPLLTSIIFVDDQDSPTINSHSTNTLRSNILSQIFDEFFGSHQEITKLINFLFNETPLLVEPTTNHFAHVVRRNKAALLVGAAGHGKSAILLLLQRIIGVDRVFYIDTRNLTEASRGIGESLLLKISQHITRQIWLLLLDNIDVFCSRSTSDFSARSISELTQTSAFKIFLDKVLVENPGCSVICSSKNGNIDPSLLVPYRLGHIATIQPLSHIDRYNMFIKLIKSDEVLFNIDHITNVFDEKTIHRDFFSMLASKTQGYTAAEIVALLHKTLKGGRSISSFDLLNELSLFRTSLFEDGGSFVDSLIKDVSGATDLPGFDKIINRLLSETIDFFTTTESKLNLLRNLGIRPSSGILITGGPGTGKTATALLLGKRSQSHFKFMSVSCAELVHKVVGETESKLSKIFECARAIAPCFLLLDDIDIMLGTNEDDNEDEPYSTPLENDVSKLTINESNRSHSPDLPIDRYRNKRTSSLAFDRLLSTLLVEIDGIGISSKIRDNLSNFEVSQSSTKCDAIALYKEKLVPQNKHGKEVQHAASKSLPDHRQVIVIATASRARHLDRALLRPGRLETHVELNLPDLKQRKEIISSLLKNKINCQNDTSILISQLAEKTSGKSPAQINSMVLEASYNYLRKHNSSSSSTADQARYNNMELTEEDFKI